MAEEKKKTDKKSEKKSEKSAVVKKGKKTVGYDVKYEVPKGGQIIKYFNLTPALPTDTGPGDWLFTEKGSSQDIKSLTVAFELNPSALERQLERAVLVVSMNQNLAANGTWRFALGGVATDKADEDPNNDLTVEIIDNGFTLIAYVQVLEGSAEYIPFGFVASFTEKDTGSVSIYESKDPGIIAKRPN